MTVTGLSWLCRFDWVNVQRPSVSVKHCMIVGVPALHTTSTEALGRTPAPLAARTRRLAAQLGPRMRGGAGRIEGFDDHLELDRPQELTDE